MGALKVLMKSKASMNTTTKMLTIIAIISVCCFAFPSISSSTKTPPGWPWRGIVMDDVDNSPSDLERIETIIPIRVVRLQLKPRLRAEKDKITAQKAWAYSLDWADKMLDKCRQLGLIGVINMSHFPFDPKINYNQTSSEFWQNDEQWKEVIRSTKELAVRLASRKSEFIAYDIMSEPAMIVAGKAIRPPQLSAFHAELVKVIRETDPKRWIVISPGPWGGPGGYRDFTPVSDNMVIYGVHMYLPHQFTHQGIREYRSRQTYPGFIGRKNWDARELEDALRPVIRFQSKYNVPVWVGEFSAVRWANGGEQYVKDLVTIFERHNMGWAYFSFGNWHGWHPDYNDKETLKGQDPKANYVGEKSARWQTLKTIFRRSY